MPIPRPCIAPGNSIRFRCWLRPSEWRTLSEGLVQRARLLNMLLVDLYGPQKLLQQGLVPPELLFAHAGFLCVLPWLARAARRDAAHVRRPTWPVGPTATGKCWPIARRPLRAPAMRWKTASSSRACCPTIFHDCQVERLASFFITLRETLQDLAQQHRENPRIVLLSHGPQSTTYFEDAYLARYLGYTLVTGGDLAVRDNRVFLKTLGGLLPVDVDPAAVVRRRLRSAGIAGRFGRWACRPWCRRPGRATW